MLRPFLALTVFCALLATGWLAFAAVASSEQSNQNSKPAQSNQNSNTSSKQNTPPKEIKLDKKQKEPTAEQVAESTIFIYGSRPVLAQIRRNGVERGRITRFMSEGKTEESTYERRFVRGENAEKDKIRLDQKLPTMEYSLIFGEGKLWGIINGATFVPRQDTAAAFLSQHRHSIETLLRYKENGATLNLIGRDKQKGLELYVLDLTDKDKRTTRYYISARTLHVLWLEYEEPNPSGTPVKYSKKFFDYRYAQSTLVPYRTVLLLDGRETQETRIMTVTFGVKVDDSLFQSPQA
ncbi:MAG TPA: hypothetical protein VFH31_08860 [Pyrinomonadaceae bacterium]|nr:hypothetical protein [Pyrinomonadaceae bacterium]